MWTKKGIVLGPMVSLIKIMLGWKAIIPHCQCLTEGHIIMVVVI